MSEPNQSTQKSGFSVASLILGILSLMTNVFGGFIFAIPAILLGYQSLLNIAKSPKVTGKGMAVSGIIMGWITIFLSVSILYIWTLISIPMVQKFGSLSEQAQRAACRSNQGAIESACAIYYAMRAARGESPTFPFDYNDPSIYAGGVVPTCPSTKPNRPANWRQCLSKT